MNLFSGLALAVGWLAILACCWLGWQLLRQNGRILLRLDDLEERLNAIEFGEDEAAAGLPVGTEAPAFELPDLAGERKSLAQFRGHPLLLIFFNPDCGFCRELMPKLAAVAAGFQPAGEGGILPPGTSAPSTVVEESSETPPQTDTHSAGLEARLNGRQGYPPLHILILTNGDAEKNREFFAEHKLDCPVLLQQDGEVAQAYLANGTPSGYLISAEGKIASRLALGAEALLKLADGKSEVRSPKSEADQSRLTSAATEGNGRATRFGNRSLARSKIKRDGLQAGTPAPDFRLPRLDGRGDLTLSELRGQRVLLVFSSPGCGPCNALAPGLEKFHRATLTPAFRENLSASERPLTCSLSPGRGEGVRRTGEREFGDIAVIMISRGEPKENRAKVKEHRLTFPILLQQQWEISRRYAMFATPIAYWIDEMGVIARDVAVGLEPIEALMAEVARGLEESPSLISGNVPVNAARLPT